MPDAPAAPRSGRRPAQPLRDRTTLAFPELITRVWAMSDGMHLKATMLVPGRGEYPNTVTIAEAVWQPSEVTQVSVVDWAYRALRKWLEDQMLPGMVDQ